jgi:hypothetical protein
MTRLALPQVTLCAATSVNVAATIQALEHSLDRIDFGACLLFTDAPVQVRNPAIRLVPISHLGSVQAYSHFMLAQLADHVATSHCLVVQWDGHVLDAGRWDPAFLEADFIGARWPQFGDGHDVGNGGFSLRSRRLLQACQSARFRHDQPEDVQIGRTHRTWLEAQGLRFAPNAVADRFSAERAGDPLASFGYHGVWHMPRVLGTEAFWQRYRTLDERGAVRHDLGALLKQISTGQNGLARALQLLSDRAVDAINRG